MKDIFLSFLVPIILQIESCTSQGRYCQEAVNSVEIVESCPSSKAEWDDAARRKDCGRLASKQNCTTAEQFQYHCVINGPGDKLLEVCGPRRIIFGHCVEFNVLGGVIQEQLSAPCNATFPKCDDYYYSSDAYKYPDCYQLVSKSDSIHVSRTTSAESTPTDISPAIITSIVLSTFLFISAILSCFCFRFFKKEKRTHINFIIGKTINHKEDASKTEFDDLGVLQPDLNHKEDASKAKFDDLVVLQPDSNHKEDASKAEFDDLGVLQPDSNHKEDASKAKFGDLGVLQPDPNHKEDASKAKFDDLGVFQSDPNHKEDASTAKFDDLGVLQPDTNHKEDASKAELDDLGVLQPDSKSLCTSEVSTGMNSVAPSSSASSCYDEQETRELVSSPVKEDETHL